MSVQTLPSSICARPSRSYKQPQGWDRSDRAMRQADDIAPSWSADIPLPQDATSKRKQYRELVTPYRSLGKSKNHATVLKHWTSFGRETDRLRTPCVTAAGLQSDLIEFIGYLLSLGTVGGSSIETYVTLLPAALAGRDNLFLPPFRIPRTVRFALEHIAREVPQTRPLHRGAATLPIIRNLNADDAIPYATRAAVVVQYHLGFRGINVYITKKGSKQRALHWGDCTQQGHGPLRSWSVRVRMEKTAKKHTGTFADKVLAVPDESSTPCPVSAMDKMWSLRTRDNPHDCVFPAVNYKKVAAALAKHSPPGMQLSPHSIRIGAATDVKDAGLSERVIQLKGNWSSPQSSNRYLRGSVAASKAEMSAVAKVTVGTSLQIPAPAAAAAATSGITEAARTVQPQATLTEEPAAAEPATFDNLHASVYRNFTDNVLLLLRRASPERIWAYFYDPDEHTRVLRRRQYGRMHLGHYEPIRQDQLHYFLTYSVPYEEPLTAQLAEDRSFLRSAPMSKSALVGRRNPAHSDASL